MSSSQFQMKTQEGENLAMPRVAVVIPMFNAQEHIAKVIAGVPAMVSTVVVVDDCSTDASLERARVVADPRVHFVIHDHNQGVGAAVLSGYRRASELGAEVIVKMDADDQMDPTYLSRLVGPILEGKADYTKGNRFLHFRQLSAMPLLRRAGNFGLSFMTKVASGYWNVFDPTNGYVAIHAALVGSLDEHRIAKRYYFETSMLVELSAMRAVVRDVFIPARYGKEESRLSEARAFLGFPPRLFVAFLSRLWTQYFLRDFGILTVFLLAGLALTSFGGLFGVYHWVGAARRGVATPAGTVMLAVLPIILGVQCLLQAIVLDVQGVPSEPVHGEMAQREPPSPR